MSEEMIPAKDVTEHQEAVRDELLKRFDALGITSDIDGGGCDSGDWRDFTLAELRIGLNGIEEHYDDQLAALTAERDQLKLERDVWMGRVDREQKITKEFRAERDEARKELAEWRTKTLDVENHPVVVALRAERDKARESESDARGLADCAMKSAEINIAELARMRAAWIDARKCIRAMREHVVVQGNTSGFIQYAASPMKLHEILAEYDQRNHDQPSDEIAGDAQMPAKT